MRLIWRDETLAAFDKPSGLAVHRGWAHDRVVALTLARDALGQHVHLVHRLDRGTSGVLLFALSPAVVATVQQAFEAGLVRKTYVALVRGIPPAHGTIDHPVPRTEGGERVPAVSDFQRLGVLLDRYALVLVQPRTGRFHQVRRHMKHLSCPLIGDSNYGKSEHNRRWRDHYGLQRLALHALRLELPHPSTGEPLCWTAPVPEDLLAPLRAAGATSTLLEALHTARMSGQTSSPAPSNTAGSSSKKH